MRFIVLGISLWTLSASLCFAEGLDTLIEVARSQGDIQKSYCEETDTYNQVKRGVDSGSIKKGQLKDDIMRRYGSPVVILHDAATNREKWVYKPATADFFNGIKIYLFFDNNDKLDEIAVTGAKEGKK